MPSTTPLRFGRPDGARPLLVAAVALLSGCAADANADVELHVFAASSLSEAFNEVASGFEAEVDGVDVVVTYAGSQTLRLQIEHGASPHLFASADAEHVSALSRAGLVSRDTLMAWNELAVVVPAERVSIESFSDLQEPHRLVIGHREVPIGRYVPLRQWVLCSHR